MKKFLKNTLSISIMSFVLCFMLFIYEQILTYSQNVNDYWFNLKDLIINNLILFVVVFIFLEIINFSIYLLSNKLNKLTLYNIYKIIFFIAFIVTYIHGNYLVGSLPKLDGSPIIWSNYTMQNIISILLILFVSIVSIIIYKKYNKYLDKTFTYTSLVIFAMIFVSFITIFITNTDMYSEKGTYVATNDNINTLSQDKNLLILLTDCINSQDFDRIITNYNKKNVFKDFTYYPDTLSTYGFTRDSIPFILSGIWYEAQMPYNDYYKYALDNSKLFSLLKDNNYDINIYDEELQVLNNDNNFKNVKSINSKINLISLVKQEMKYIMFKYLPFPLKKYSSIESLNYNKCKDILDKSNVFSWSNKINYDILDDIKIKKNNYFQFIHIEGGHFPYDLNENMVNIENGTYDDKILSSITVVEKYLNRIKESGMYDNSAIIIMADHGYNDYEYVGRQNPILLIKGFNEKHDLEYSNKKVSYVDLNDSIYSDLINGKKSSELLSDVEDNRVRRYLYYKDYDKMKEQLLDGHAWETDKLKDTGKKFER